jgi:hypothetical protein
MLSGAAVTITPWREWPMRNQWFKGGVCHSGYVCTMTFLGMEFPQDPLAVLTGTKMKGQGLGGRVQGAGRKIEALSRRA